MQRKKRPASPEKTASYDVEDATYDKNAKDLLSMRKILAPILRRTVTEFRHLDLDTIANDCIEGTPLVGSVPVTPGRTNRQHQRRLPKKLRGFANEQSELGEGWITFDVLFYAHVPKTGKRIKLIINVEAQRKETNYRLMKRAAYYAFRLVSSQKERDFVGEDYDSICKVYTIWLCFYLPKGEASAINHYELNETCDYGTHHEPREDYDLVHITTVHIGDDEPADELLKFLKLVFIDQLTAKEKAQRLQDEFHFDTDKETRKGLTKMCNLSMGLKERAKAEGEARGRAEGKGEMILSMLKEHTHLDFIERISGWTGEEIRALAQKNGLAVE